MQPLPADGLAAARVEVSVSVTTYNQDRFLGRALDGILMQQTTFPFDIVIGDDCSTDGTTAIVQEYCARYPGRILHIRPERNLGRNGAPMFHETLRHCRGRYIAMLDGDDYWTAPHKLQRQAEYLDARPQVFLCYHNTARVDEAGVVATSLTNPPGHPEFTGMRDILRTNFVSSPSPMIRRELLEDAPDWLWRAPFGDYPLYLWAADRGPLGFIDEVMAVYSIHSGGVWSHGGGVERAEQFVAFLESLDPSFVRRHGVADVLARRLVTLARVYATGGKRAAAVGALLRAFARGPRAATRESARVVGNRIAAAGRGAAATRA